MEKQLTKLQNIARVSKPVTWFLGSEYETSLDLIVLLLPRSCGRRLGFTA